MCVFPLQHYSYHVAPRLVHQFFLFPAEPPLGLHSSLVLTCYVSQLLVPSYLLFASAMPRLRGKSKQGSAWYQNRPRMAIRPQPAPTPSHNSPPSSPSSSGQSSQSQSGLPPLSSPWACRVEWFDLLGNSLGFSPSPLPDLASSSQPALVIPPNSPENSSPEPPPVHPPLVQSPQEDTSVHREKPPDQPHSCSDCASCAKFQDDLAILQDLVFEVRKEVDDLWFRLEILDKKGRKFCKCYPLCKALDTPQNRHPVHQRPQRWSWFLALQMPAVDNSAMVSASTLQAPTMDNVARNKPTA
jgi:hypothetical protein